jgi:hypothetical protein
MDVLTLPRRNQSPQQVPSMPRRRVRRPCRERHGIRPPRRIGRWRAPDGSRWGLPLIRSRKRFSAWRQAAGRFFGRFRAGNSAARLECRATIGYHGGVAWSVSERRPNRKNGFGKFVPSSFLRGSCLSPARCGSAPVFPQHPGYRRSWEAYTKHRKDRWRSAAGRPPPGRIENHRQDLASFAAENTRLTT